MREIVVVVLVCCAAAAAQDSGTLAGRVLFADGTPVAGAKVKIAGDQTLETGADGRGEFSFQNLRPGAYQLSVAEDGVAGGGRTIEVRRGENSRVELVVSLAARRESVTVSATLGPRDAAGLPSNVVVFDGQRLRGSPGATLDKALSAVPGFSLFRRTSSLSSHPTSQGLSLRGVGPSGASRSLVLADGFPINDPFGGWVYWNRIPREAIASAEVLRGAASSLYGNAALSGVASLLSERPQGNMLRASLSGGSTGLVVASWLAGTRSRDGRWGFSLDGEAFRNDGYYALRQRDRGTADAPFALSYLSARARVERSLSGGGLVYASFGILTEDRENGTRILNNSTDLRYGTLGAEWRAGGGVWRAGLFAQGETLRSTFSSVTNFRNREALTLTQRVPSNAVTGRLDWSRGFAGHHVTVGGDVRWVEGASHEQSATALAILGGEQWSGGAFVQDVFSPAPKWQLIGSLRADRWVSTDQRTGQASEATVLNPQLGVRYQAASRVALRAQGYRGFRGPTLNELYRQFQVGNTITRANSALRPERTNGGEGGVDVQSEIGMVRLTGFWTELREPVSNVTLSTGATIIRQRQNVGRARIRGIEADWEWRPRPRVELRASYLFDDAVVARFVPDRRLEGLRLPQVPRHQGFVSLEFIGWRRSVLRLETRLSGVQFDDDRNLLPLAGFGDAGASLTVPLAERWEWFVRAENLFDRRYPVARTPVETLGSPRIAQVGIRFRM